MNLEAQKELATALRKAQKLREASYNELAQRECQTYRSCANEATDNAPWAPIVACLLTAGFYEMWEFCDAVLGPEGKP